MMTDVPRPEFSRLLWATLVALRALGGSGTNAEIEAKAIEAAGLTEAQQAVLHKGGPKTEASYRLDWARSYLGAYGAIERSGRAVWSMTDVGRGLSEADMTAVEQFYRGKLEKRRAERKDDAPPAPGQSRSSGDPFSTTETALWQDLLLETLQAMPPAAFERLCQRLLRECGFTRVEVTGRSGDGGIDGVGVLRVSLVSFQVFFQCKRYKGSVTAGAVRDFRGAMQGRGDKGLLITTGSFTTDATREATRDGAPVLDLIDGQSLCQLLKDHTLGVTTQQVEQVTIDPAWYAAI